MDRSNGKRWFAAQTTSLRNQEAARVSSIQERFYCEDYEE
jgi:hypothetical protein